VVQVPLSRAENLAVVSARSQEMVRAEHGLRAMDFAVRHVSPNRVVSGRAARSHPCHAAKRAEAAVVAIAVANERFVPNIVTIKLERQYGEIPPTFAWPRRPSLPQSRRSFRMRISACLRGYPFKCEGPSCWTKKKHSHGATYSFSGTPARTKTNAPSPIRRSGSDRERGGQIHRRR